MKILFVLHQFLPRHVTGTEQYVRSLALGLRQRGHDVRIFAVEPQLHLEEPDRTWIARDDDVDGIPVRRVGLHEAVVRNADLIDHLDPVLGGLLRRYLVQESFDLVHVFHLRNLGTAGLDEPLRLGLPTVVNLMDFWFLCPRFTLLTAEGELCDGPPDGGRGCVGCVDPALGRALEGDFLDGPLGRRVEERALAEGFSGRPLDRWRALVGRKDRLLGALEGAGRILAPSRFLRGRFEAQGFPEGVIQHLPYGVDPARLGGRRKQPGEVRKGPIRLGYVGSLTPHKGLHVLLDALRRIGGEAWALSIHGSLEVHPEYSRRLLEEARDDRRIEFAGEFRPTELGEVLDRIDLLVVPSLWYENTPFTILEAGMMGLPVLASDLGGISEVVEEGRNGMLFRPDDAGDLARRLAGILEAPERLPGLCREGDSRTLDDNLTDFEALYSELIADRPTRPVDPDA